jgi:hypothetical protein
MKEAGDYCKWLSEQLEALRRKDHAALDWNALADEVEGVLGRYRSEPKHWAGKIMRVLLRQDFRYGDWNRLRFCTGRLAGALDQSPSLRASEAQILNEEYVRILNLCRLDAMDLEGWPESNPWPTVAALLEAAEIRCRKFAAREREGAFL